MVPMARDSLHEAAEGTAGRNAEDSLQSVNLTTPTTSLNS